MRKNKALLDTFRSLPIFSHCTDEELEEIDRLADEVTVPAGRVLISQGDIGREFIVVVEGEAEVTRDGERIAAIGPGGYVGELALLESLERNASVTATTEMRIQVIDRRGFQTLLEDSPTLTLNLLRATAKRLSELDDEITQLRRR